MLLPADLGEDSLSLRLALLDHTKTFLSYGTWLTDLPNLIALASFVLRT